jgi:hypothetical protein
MNLDMGVLVLNFMYLIVLQVWETFSLHGQ